MTNPNIPNNEDSKKFIVYTSSAGSGKTYTLSRFFIRLLLQNDNPSYFRTIAALTFTNKAANEMKERIFNNLVVLSQDVSKITDEKKRTETFRLLEDYSSYIGISKEKTQEQSAKIVSEILHNYTDLTVQTIDKFTHKIIRPFSRDLNISPDFSIELGEDDIIKKSVDLLLQKSSGDEFLSKILLDFAYYKVEEGKRFQTFEDDLNGLASVFKKEDAISYLNNYREYTLSFFFDKKQEIKHKLADVTKLITSEAKQAVSLFKSKGIDALDFYYTKSGVGVFFEKIANGDVPNSINSSVLKALEEDKWYTDNKHSSAALIDEISPALKQHLAIIVEHLPNYFNMQFLYARIFPTALLNEIEKIINDVKESQNILTISDFNKLISELINSSHLSVPFLYERIGERYNHYLIDEFQDTSVLQWNNLLPLIDDSLAKGNANLLVGDGKQAIYRFRNGDVEQFVQLPKLINKSNENYHHFENTLERNFKKETLATNYRSYSNIIEFNNELFKAIYPSLNPYQQKIYEDVAQKSSGKNGGYVNVQFYEGKTFKDEAKEYTLTAIKDALNCGYNLSDMAVLVRTRNEINDVAEYLVSNAIEVISEESLKLTYSKDVRVVVEYFKLLVNPSDVLQAVSLLMALAPNLNTQELHNLLKEKTVWKFLQDEYSVYKSNVQFSVFEAMSNAVKSFGLDENTTYFQQFKSYVWERFKKEGVSISDFVSLWKVLEEKNNIPSLKNAASANAVQIITAHKSKGLQFKVVIIPFANWTVNFRETIKWIQPEGVDDLTHLAVNITPNTLQKTPYSLIAEEESKEAFLESLNILYVALTRAEEHLYVFVESKKGIGKEINLALQQTSIYNDNCIELGEKKKYSTQDEYRSTDLFVINKTPRIKELALHIAPNADIYWNESSANEADYGTLFHEIIRKIKTLRDVEKILSQITTDGKISTDQKEKLIQDISVMLSNSKLQEVFSENNNVFNEKEIGANGKHFRVDKLSLTPSGKIYLLDFKTGEESSAHKKQIDEYKNVLQTLKFTDIETLIYYTQTTKLLTY